METFSNSMCPYNKDYTIFGSIMGFPIFGRLPHISMHIHIYIYIYTCIYTYIGRGCRGDAISWTHPLYIRHKSGVNELPSSLILSCGGIESSENFRKSW